MVEDHRRRPAPAGAVGGAAAAVLVALAIPAFTLHTVNSGAEGLPRDLTVMKVYDRIQQHFPGGAGPAVVVVSARDVTSPQMAAGVAAHSNARRSPPE